MLDQNITTIIASGIAVLGTLGGAIAGVVLSNRHTAKMEHLRIEQERLKRNTAIAEELYELTLKIYRYSRDLFGEERFTTDLYEAIVPYILRMITLTDLHLRPIKTQCTDFIDGLETVHKAHEKYFSLAKDNRTEALQELKQCVDGYDKRYASLKEGIVELIKKS